MMSLLDKLEKAERAISRAKKRKKGRKTDVSVDFPKEIRGLIQPDDIDLDGVLNSNDCNVFNPFRQDEDEWIQEAIEDEGRVREYLRRVYGDEAFKANGNIKMKYLNKAIDRIENGPGKDIDNLLDALRLAKRLKGMN